MSVNRWEFKLITRGAEQVAYLGRTGGGRMVHHPVAHALYPFRHLSAALALAV